MALTSPFLQVEFDDASTSIQGSACGHYPQSGEQAIRECSSSWDQITCIDHQTSQPWYRYFDLVGVSSLKRGHAI